MIKIISKNNLKIEKINDDLRKKCSQLEDKLEEKTEKYNRLGTMYDKLFNDEGDKVS
jgi:predicted nuclease with TOPRIM domain